MDDIFYIDLPFLADGLHITEIANAIENAIAGGMSNFIIDLRGNGGGNSLAGQRLIEAMGIEVPVFGSIQRISPLLLEAHSFMWYLRPLMWIGVDYMSFSPYIPANNNPNGGFLFLF